jgi:hypothetical protein
MASQFLDDRRPDAYERLVSRLLASPHFGERWAQHWLDVARFAETNGYELDGDRPHAWRFRDWAVNALNADLTYDRFVAMQLAGDLMEGKEGLFAVGLNRCGPIHKVSGNVDPREVRQEFLNEATGAVGAAFLGLTLACARCHDHKFDPVSQKDYYQIEAFFSRAKEAEVNLASALETAAHARSMTAWSAQLAPLKLAVSKIDAPYEKRIRAEKLAKLEKKYRDALAVPASKRTEEQQRLVKETGPLLKASWDEVLEVLSPADRERRAALREKIHALMAIAPQPPTHAWSLKEEKGRLVAKILKRGNYKTPGKEVKAGFPAALPGKGAPAEDRRALAAWLTRKDNPLTARVIVNRIWQHHFGRGLVSTPNDFGTRGAKPSHPELLDWLAVELVESGWSLKHIHRLIVTSAAYRMRSDVDNVAAQKIDPDNALLWRANRRRLEGEALRDAALVVSGRFVPWVGGPSIRAPIEPEVYDLIFTEGEPDGLWPVHPDERQHSRRSLYLLNKRNVRLPILEALDQPDTLTSCGIRPVSTYAPQALILLNGPLMQEQAREMAARVWREAGAGPGRQADRASWLALSRPATKAEIALAREFLVEQAGLLRERLRARRMVSLPRDIPEGAGPAEMAALADYCLALLNRNGFVYID